MTDTTHIERVTLDIEAPANKLQTRDSGLNVAIDQLRTIETILTRIDARYDRFSSRRVNPFPTPPRQPSPPRPGRTPLEIPRTAPEPAPRPGRNLVDDVKHNGARVASYAALYGALRLVNSGMNAHIDLQYKEARLAAVMRDPTQVGRLKDSVLALAAANGRDASEAMEAAIAWSRLGLSRLQVQEAVRVSLMAANVAEIKAGEATEHLSALMATYGLRVGELSGVLSGLNAISNTYNVTNREMLQGLTKTAAIAKQAGIPLKELMGLIGAGVGSTKQTGANIGQGLKSIIGSLSSADKQDKLRSEFKFEVTDGATSELKGMSQILAELFVKYQELSRAERQTMLFGVAGKHQASRLAAILDNYVRAQVLAVTATSNLSSAERENALITETLQSNLKGLVTEFQRFADIQGSNGPGQGLNELAKALRNLLSIANTGAGSAAATGFAGLLAAIGVKLALVGYQMEKTRIAKGGLDKALGKRGVLSNFFGAVARSANDLRRTLEAAAISAPVWAQRIGMIGTGATAAAKGVTLLRGATIVALGALAEFIVPILVITGAIVGFNYAMKATGITSEKTSEAVGKFARQAEIAANAAESAALASRLFAAAQDALSNNQSLDERLKILSDLSDAAFPSSANASSSERQANEAKSKALKIELKDLERKGDVHRRNAILEQLSADASARNARERQKEYELLNRQIEEYRKSLNDIKNKPLVGGLTQTGKKKQAAEVAGSLSELENKRAGMIMRDAEEAERGLEAVRNSSREVQVALESNRVVIEALKALYDSLPESGQVDSLNKELAAHRAIYTLLSKNHELVQKQIHDRAAADDAPGLRAQIAERRRVVGSANKNSAQRFREAFVPTFPHGAIGTEASIVVDGGDQEMEGYFDDAGRLLPEKVRELAASSDEWATKLKGVLGVLTEIHSQEQAIQALERQADQSEHGRSTQQLEAAESEIAKEREKARVALEAAEAARGIAERRDRNAIALSLADSRADSFAVGDGVGEQFVNQRKRLEIEATKAERQAAKLSAEPKKAVEVENLHVTALEHRVRLTSQLIEGEKMLIDLGREEQNLLIQKNREYQRGLMTSGPGELLRKLAVNQLSQRPGGMRGGNFFALSTDARQDFLSRPENDERRRSILRDWTALRRGGFGRRSVEEIQETYRTQQNARKNLYDQAGAGTMEINAAARDAANSLSTFSKATTLATIALSRFEAQLNSAGGAAVPRTAQATAVR